MLIPGEVYTVTRGAFRGKTVVFCFYNPKGFADCRLVGDQPPYRGGDIVVLSVQDLTEEESCSC